MSREQQDGSVDLLAIVTDYFESVGQTIEVDRERSMASCQIAGRNATFRLFVFVDQESRTIAAVAPSSHLVPEGQRSSVSELLVRANFGLRLGSLDLDWNDGEVRSRVTVSMADTVPSRSMIQTLVVAASHLLDEHHLALVAVMNARATPTAALEPGWRPPVDLSGLPTEADLEADDDNEMQPEGGADWDDEDDRPSREDYIDAWSRTNELYDLSGRTITKRPLVVHLPSDIADIHWASRRLTTGEAEQLADRIRRYKVIPSLSFFPLRDGMKQTWWFVPFAVAAERIASWLAVDKNGIYLASRDDEDSSFVSDFSEVESVCWEDDEEGMRRLELYYTGGGVISFEEWIMPEPTGSYLQVLDAILDVYMPVIEASRGVGIWRHGAGGEGYQNFASWEELLQDGGKWDSADRPESLGG